MSAKIGILCTSMVHKRVVLPRNTTTDMEASMTSEGGVPSLDWVEPSYFPYLFYSGRVLHRSHVGMLTGLRSIIAIVSGHYHPWAMARKK